MKTKILTMKSRVFIVTLLIVFFSTMSVSAQIDLKGKLRDRLDRKVDQGLDKAEEAAKKKEKKSEEAEATGEEEGNQNNSKAEQSKVPAQEVKTSLQTFSKYDFVPGDQVLFFEDYSQDNIGDFPPLWYTNKGGEVQTTNLFPGKWFMMKEEGMYFFEKGFTFPENFTLEFDVIPMSPEGVDAQSVGFDLNLLSAEEGDLYPSMAVPGKSGLGMSIRTYNGTHSYSGYKESNYTINGDYSKESGLLRKGEVNHVAIWVQKTRFRLYLHGEKIFDIPKIFTPGHTLNQIRFYLSEESAPLFSNFRIAKAGADQRSKFMTEGKIVSYGIYFDSGKDVVKPESFGSLKEISTILKENPNVRVKIVGHTDSDGEDAANLLLSKKRADAVKQALIKEFAIEGSRIETDGKGETQAISPNTNPEGKAKNRRVEFLKL
jgi:OOP family OmpA-OmpF porin